MENLPRYYHNPRPFGRKPPKPTSAELERSANRRAGIAFLILAMVCFILSYLTNAPVIALFAIVFLSSAVLCVAEDWEQ